jgi:uncharacterized cupredoxin-like copper-binding protein
MSQAPRALVALALSPAVLLAVGVGFAAEGHGHYATSTAHAKPAAHVIRVDADPSGALAFTQKSLTALAGKDRFVFHNASSMPHDLAIKRHGKTYGPTATISDGKTATLIATLKPGKFTFYCAVPGHEQAGMKGILTVK